MSQQKALTGLKIVDEAKGQVKAVFSTFGVIDHDGDVTLPGAFTEGQKVRISAYNHESWKGALPVGKGTIHADDEKAWLDGEFFMDTTAGRDTFAVVKGLEDLGEWSYGYDVVDGEPGQKDGRDVTFLKTLDVHEVSPVLLGAGIGTHTVAVKGLKVEDTDALVEALVSKGLEEAADAVAKGIEDFDGLFAFLAKALEQVDDERVAGWRRADEKGLDGDEFDRLDRAFAALKGRVQGEPNVNTEIRKAQRSMARARLLLSNKYEEDSE